MLPPGIKQTGNHSRSVSKPLRLSDADIRKMKEEAQMNADADKRMKEEIDN